MSKNDTTTLEPDVDIDLDDFEAKPAIPPARVRIGGREFEVSAPDAGLVMEIEEAGTTARVLSLLFDDQWPDVRPLLESKAPEQLMNLVAQLGDRFGFSQRAMIEQAAPNRAARRRRGARR